MCHSSRGSAAADGSQFLPVAARESLSLVLDISSLAHVLDEDWGGTGGRGAPRRPAKQSKLIGRFEAAPNASERSTEAGWMTDRWIFYQDDKRAR